MKTPALLFPALLVASATLGLAVWSGRSPSPIAEAEARGVATDRVSAGDVERAIRAGDRAEAQQLLNQLRQTTPSSKSLTNLQMAIDIAVP